MVPAEWGMVDGKALTAEQAAEIQATFLRPCRFRQATEAEQRASEARRLAARRVRERARYAARKAAKIEAELDAADAAEGLGV